MEKQKSEYFYDSIIYRCVAIYIIIMCFFNLMVYCLPLGDLVGYVI